MEHRSSIWIKEMTLVNASLIHSEIPQCPKCFSRPLVSFYLQDRLGAEPASTSMKHFELLFQIGSTLNTEKVSGHGRRGYHMLFHYLPASTYRLSQIDHW